MPCTPLDENERRHSGRQSCLILCRFGARLKYLRIDPALREQKRREWNQPLWWPLVLAALIMVGIALPAVVAWRRRERGTAQP